MKKLFIEQIKKAREVQHAMARLPVTKRKEVLHTLSRLLIKNSDRIKVANSKDVQAAYTVGRDEAFINRLEITKKQITEIAHSVRSIARDIVAPGKIIQQKTLANGVVLQKQQVPLGIIFMIYESRPNVTIDAFCLCFASGNTIVLKGGKEALETNRILIEIIRKALKAHRVSTDGVVFIDTADREVVCTILKRADIIDVVIPRGGYDLVQTVVSDSTIPVLYHAEGGARIYVDSSAIVGEAIKIVINAKTSRPATCNSLDTLLVHESIAPRLLPALYTKLAAHGVTIKGDVRVKQIIPVVPLVKSDLAREYLSLTLNIVVVSNIDVAIHHINHYTKGHTEGIIATSRASIARFKAAVSSACICVNCSTRLHDGTVFEKGAEMGIATGKLHARGPVGIEELSTYQWILEGAGQIRQ